MKIYFRTKTNLNGNYRSLWYDLETMKYCYGYNNLRCKDGDKLTAQAIKTIKQHLKDSGLTELAE